MNPALQQVIDISEQSVQGGPYAQGYHAILAAGLKAMFSDETFHFMKDYLKTVQSAEQVPDAVSHGIIKLLSIIWNESDGNMPLEPIGPATMTLMAHALDYVESVMKIRIDNETVAQTTLLVNKGMLYFMKVTLNLSDEDFDKLMSGRGQELMNAQQQQSAGGVPPQPGAVAPSQSGLVEQPTPPMQGVM